MSELSVTVKPAAELSAKERTTWMAMRDGNAALYSPYFHPDYTLAVADVKEGVNVLIARRADTIVCFLPFEGKAFARPAGMPMTDYHGFICHTDADFDPVDVLAAAGIGVFRFDNMAGSVQGVERVAVGEAKTALISLPEGAQAWRESQDRSYKKNLKDINRRTRKAEAEVGVPRTTFNVTDNTVFDTLIDWKRKQFELTGLYDVLEADWTLKLLKKLWLIPDEPGELRVDLHTLHFGEHLAAIDMGLTAGKCYHSWIVAYDPEFQKYSPGSQLLEAILTHNSELGYDRIDLGAGIEGYKRNYASDPRPIYQGFFAVKGPAKLLTKAYAAAERLGEKAPLGGVGKLPGKLRRRYSQIAACEETLSGRTKAMLSAVKNSGKR